MDRYIKQLYPAWEGFRTSFVKFWSHQIKKTYPKPFHNTKTKHILCWFFSCGWISRSQKLWKKSILLVQFYCTEEEAALIFFAQQGRKRRELLFKVLVLVILNLSPWLQDVLLLHIHFLPIDSSKRKTNRQATFCCTFFLFPDCGGSLGKDGLFSMMSSFRFSPVRENMGKKGLGMTW